MFKKILGIFPRDFRITLFLLFGSLFGEDFVGALRENSRKKTSSGYPYVNC